MCVCVCVCVCIYMCVEMTTTAQAMLNAVHNAYSIPLDLCVGRDWIEYESNMRQHVANDFMNWVGCVRELIEVFDGKRPDELNTHANNGYKHALDSIDDIKKFRDSQRRTMLRNMPKALRELADYNTPPAGSNSVAFEMLEENLQRYRASLSFYHTILQWVRTMDGDFSDWDGYLYDVILERSDAEFESECSVLRDRMRQAGKDKLSTTATDDLIESIYAFDAFALNFGRLAVRANHQVIHSLRNQELPVMSAVREFNARSAVHEQRRLMRLRFLDQARVIRRTQEKRLKEARERSRLRRELRYKAQRALREAKEMMDEHGNDLRRAHATVVRDDDDEVIVVDTDDDATVVRDDDDEVVGVEADDDASDTY